MKKVIILCSALVFDFLTCSDASAVAQERIDNVQSADSATVVTDTLSELRRTARFASELGVRLDGELVNVEKEYTECVNKFKSINAGKRQMWTGDLKLKVGENDNVRFENIGNTNKCLGRGLNTLKEILNEINRRINRLQNAIYAEIPQREQAGNQRQQQNGGLPEPAQGQQQAGNQRQQQNGGLPEPAQGQQQAGNQRQQQNGGLPEPAQGQQQAGDQDNAGAGNFNFEDITSIEDVNRLTQEQCQLAVINGIIDREGFFSFGINDNDRAQREAIEGIINATQNAGGNTGIVGRLDSYSAKIRVLITRNSNLFKDVEFVRGIRGHLRIFHNELLNSYNTARIKLGHPYLRFLIVDKI